MEKKKPGTVYKTLSNVSLVGLFLSVGILVVGLFQGYMTAGLVLTLSILSIIFACCALSLVWVRNIERKRYFKTSIVFLALTGACCILWIISAIVIYSMVKSKGGDLSGYLNFIRIALVISLQFVFANVIARNIIKYKKAYVAFQAIYYVSCLYLDVFFSLLALALKFTSADGVKLNESITEMLFGNGLMLTLFILACVYVVMANSILKSIDKKKGVKTGRRTIISSLFDDPEFEDDIPKENKESNVETKPLTSPVKEESKKEEDNSTQERLEQLQNLYDQKLITEEEYNQKRADILQDL